jgi:hypothetical protein
MAIRNPIVYVNGYPEELANSDRLNGVGKSTVSATAPSNPESGDLWLDTNGDILKIYKSGVWTEPTEDLSTAVISGSAPSNPTNGLLWFDTTSNQLKVYVGSSSTWELAESQTYIAASAPSSPLAGEFWWDTSETRLKIYTGSAWAYIGHKTFSAATAPTSGMIEGDWWYDSVSGAFSMYIAGSINAWTIVSSGGSGGGGSIADILAFG